MSNSRIKQSLNISSNIIYIRKQRLLNTFDQLMPYLRGKIRIAGAVILIATALPIWVASEIITIQQANAYTARADLIIDRLPEETYETMLRRAEAVARAAAQRSFDQDILITDVSVIVSGQNYGAIAPVLELRVSRDQWRNRPDAAIWATYFKSTNSLLMFTQPAATPTETPATANAAN